MKKTLIAFLLSLVVAVGATCVIYKDAVKHMVDMGEDYFNQLIGKEPTDPDDSKPKVTVKSIELDTTNAKLNFAFGEEFSAEGLKVIATMSDGTTKEVDVNDCRIFKPNMMGAGSREVSVTYSNRTARYMIEIAQRVLPSISTTSLLDIVGENATQAYRVEAETIDMSNVKKANGVDSFVAESKIDDSIASNDKYLTGFNVAYNYFGFTFTASEAFENTTLVLRIANKSTSDIIPSDVLKLYMNYTDGEGLIPLEGYSVAYSEKGEWVDLVIHGVNIPAGTNTLTFDVMNNTAYNLDYIDFYVGMPYLSSNCTIELAEGALVVKDLETLDTQKAFTRQDVADAFGLKPGQLRIETPGKKETAGKPTNNGTSVAAIGQGSQFTTILSLEQNATVRIKIRAAKADPDRTDYYVADHWNFYLDNTKLVLVERNDILGGNAKAAMYWDWMYTDIGSYNLAAGKHLFMFETVGVDCNVDTLEFEVISYGEYAASGSDLKDQHKCESVCPACGKCTDLDCQYGACIEKCNGNCEYDAYITDAATSYRIEAEKLSKSTLVGDSVGVQVEERPHATGLGHIAAGGYQTFKVRSEKDVTVALSISFANAGGGSILKYIPGASVNGEDIQLLDGEVPAGIGSAGSNYDGFYWNIAVIKLAEIKLTANTDYEIKILANAGNLDAYILDVLPEHVHTEETVAGKAATCTETGLTEGKKCSECGETLVEQEVIPAKGHTEVVDAAVAATCTTAGKTEGKHCSVCSEVLVAQETIDALGHKDVDPVDFVCDVCNTDLCTEHQAGEPVKENEVESTCEKAGSYDNVVKCSVCGEELSRTTVSLEKLAHTPAEAVVENDVESTCKVAGSYDSVVYCSVCETEISRNTVDKALADHTWDNDQDVDCNVCGETRIVKLTTPDNSANKLFYITADGNYIEIDRSGSTMFVTGAEYILFYVYESADANKEAYVGQFKMLRYDGDATTKVCTSLKSLDDAYEANVIQGGNTNFWIEKSRFTAVHELLENILGYNYSYGQTYYFAAQAVAAEGGNYESSDISEISATGIVRDASKGTDKYTVTVENGTIDGERTTVTAGYGVDVTLTVSGENEGSFKGWYLVDAEGNEIGEVLSTATEYVYTVTENATVKAVFVVEKTKLATPDNSASKLFYYANANYIEIDRATDADGNRVSMFVTGTDHVVFYVYESADADKADYVAQFTLYGSTTTVVEKAAFTSVDGSKSIKVVLGENGNFYIYKTEFDAVHNFLRDLIGYNYSYGQTYYFAAQAVAAEGTAYESSDISEISATGIVRDASKGTDKYTVTVGNGTIDGERTTVTAGYGVVVNVAANAFENDEFACWKDVETGAIYSESEAFALTVTSSLTIRAYGKSETQKIKLATPDNSNNQMITFVVSGSTFYIEFDRQKNADGTADTAFDEGVAFVRYHMYRDITNEAGETEKQLVSHFDVTKDGYVIDYSGATCTQKLEGDPGNFWSKMGNGTIHNWIKASYVQGAQAKGLDITEWSANETHYFACQVISNNPDLYEDSDIGAMGKGHGSI